jgi:hypothetical protein
MIGLLIIAAMVSGFSAAGQTDSVELLAGQDLYVTAPTMSACRQTQSPNEHLLLFENGFSMTIGDNKMSSKNAVIRLKNYGLDIPGMRSQAYYQAQVYLEQDVAFKQGEKAKTTTIDRVVVDGGEYLIVRFVVTGEVLVTADRQEEMSCDTLQKKELYLRYQEKAENIVEGPQISEGAKVPQAPRSIFEPGTPAVVSAEQAAQSSVVAEPAAVAKTKPTYRYPVHISAVWDPLPTIEHKKLPDGREVATVSGRFYLWQRQSADQLLEFQADSAVLYFQPGQLNAAKADKTGRDLAEGSIESVYLQGNIVMTEGRRTIRADEIYFDFMKNQAVIVNAEMRFFDEKRGLPIYLSADRLCQVSDTLFQAEQVTLTSSEFYLPQLSANAARMVLMKEENVQQRADAIEKTQAQSLAAANAKQDEAAQWEGSMYDVNMKYYNTKLFGLSRLRTRMVRPDIPLSRLVVGNDSDFGTSVQTQWKLFRMLGWKEPEGMDARLAADYYSKRGVGGGVQAEYEDENSEGEMISYIMTDRGEDDLGRTSDRENIDPKRDIRGRFGLRHREYLPDDWQATVEVGYVSDRTFMESMYRSEFNTDKGQETLLYLKQQRDNWALTILGKTRINDFETMTEELPTIEYHRKGESFWDHQLTWYSDSRISRLRDRYDEDVSSHPSERFYTFGDTRNEVDYPFMLGTVKVSPFVAGTYAYEDQNGYDLSLNGNNAGVNDTALLGEGGVRASTMFWKEDPTVQSRLWDIDGIRHILTPHIEAVAYEETELGIKQRDTVNLGLSQRWQTHRGEGDDRRSVDWLRLDVDSTWVGDGGPTSLPSASMYGPGKFIYNDPSIPVFLRRSDSYFGMVRDSINTDMEWRISDTTAILSDMNYDVESGVVQQFDAGLSRYVYPDLSYYLGSRYMRPVIVDVPDDGIYEEGSHSVVGAVTYQLSPRYWITYSQEYNFDFGRNVRNDFAIIRQYHRLFYSLEMSLDESLDNKSIMFSVWPEGVKELALGSRRYTGLVGARTEQ